MPHRDDSSCTIVLVEDDDDIGRLIAYRLERAGFAVRWFRSAADVITDAESRPPSLFLLDLMLPGIDGFQLCRSIRRNLLLGTLPIVVLTARTGESDRALAFESGANDYVTKPFRPADLILRVRELCKGRS